MGIYLTTTPSAVEDHGSENQLVLDSGCEVTLVLKGEPSEQLQTWGQMVSE